MRDIGLILGVPTVIAVGIKLYDVQLKSFEQQIKANEAHIKSLEAQNLVLKETQFDRAVTIIKGQREIYEIEKKELYQTLNNLKEQVDEANSEIQINRQAMGEFRSRAESEEEQRRALENHLAVLANQIETLK